MKQMVHWVCTGYKFHCLHIRYSRSRATTLQSFFTTRRQQMYIQKRIIVETNDALSIYCLYNLLIMYQNPMGICLFKGSKKYTRKRCKICSKLTIKTRQNEMIDNVLVSLLLTIVNFIVNIFHTLFQSVVFILYR